MRERLEPAKPGGLELRPDLLGREESPEPIVGVHQVARRSLALVVEHAEQEVPARREQLAGVSEERRVLRRVLVAERAEGADRRVALSGPELEERRDHELEAFAPASAHLRPVADLEQLHAGRAVAAALQELLEVAAAAGPDVEQVVVAGREAIEEPARGHAIAGLVGPDIERLVISLLQLVTEPGQVVLARRQIAISKRSILELPGLEHQVVHRRA